MLMQTRKWKWKAVFYMLCLGILPVLSSGTAAKHGKTTYPGSDANNIILGSSQRQILTLQSHHTLHPRITLGEKKSRDTAHNNADQQQFLVPLLSFGPNNEVNQFKWVLMLASMLQRTVLLTGIFQHYKELEDENAARHFYPLELLFQISTISNYFNATTTSYEERKGWDGEISAILKPEAPQEEIRDTYWPRLAEVLGIHMSKTPGVVNWNSSFICSDQGLEVFRLQLRRHRYVLVYPSKKRFPVGLEGLVDHFHKQPPRDSLASNNPCEAGYASALMAVSMSEALRNAAREYIRSEFGGEPFVAAHVRPYPDTCLDAWAGKGDLSLEDLKVPLCSNGGLLLDLVHSVKIVMGNHKAKRLFVLTHPLIRRRIKSIFAKMHIRPSFIDPKTPVMQRLYEEFGGPESSTLMLFAEQAIALDAVAFIGTESSTATLSILQERTVLKGYDQRQTEYLFNHQKGSIESQLIPAGEEEDTSAARGL